MHSWTRAWVVAAALIAVLFVGASGPAISSAQEPPLFWQAPGPVAPPPDDPDGFVSVIIELAPTFSLFSFGLGSVQAAQDTFESSPPVDLDVHTATSPSRPCSPP